MVLMALIPLPTEYCHEYRPVYVFVYGRLKSVGPDTNGVKDTIAYLLDPFCIAYFTVFLNGSSTATSVTGCFIKAVFVIICDLRVHFSINGFKGHERALSSQR